jgi:hypothetical protein
MFERLSCFDRWFIAPKVFRIICLSTLLTFSVPDIYILIAEIHANISFLCSSWNEIKLLKGMAL